MFYIIPFKENSILLAPMAGITDSGFRKICMKYGADGCFSEMISAKGIYYKDKKTFDLLKFGNDEQPIAVQIFGNDPESMKVAAQFIDSNYSPVSIDINMGCPAPKIFQNGDGSALMGNISIAEKVIKAVKNNTKLPVSVKFRSGIDSNRINAVEFAKMCEASGADFITVHGRTREQFYSGNADWNIIAAVAENVNIPVIANGDIIDGYSAQTVLNETGAHSIMIGRASLGNPLIFNEIKYHLIGYNKFIAPNRLDLCLEHLSYTIADKSEQIAVKEFRKHIMWYIKGCKNASKLKQQCCRISTFEQCKNIIELVKNQE